MPGKKIDVRFGEEVAGRTIVGGRNHATSSGTVSIPVGIEKVLYLAASDSEFKSRLLSQRDETLADPRLNLDDAERELLRAIPVEQLQTMVDRIDPKAHGGRRFMRSVAACTAVLASSTALLCCDTVDTEVHFVADSGGARPQTDAQVYEDARTIGGMDALAPEMVDAEVGFYVDAGGARPDDPDADVPDADGEDAGTN